MKEQGSFLGLHLVPCWWGGEKKEGNGRDWDRHRGEARREGSHVAAEGGWKELSFRAPWRSLGRRMAPWDRDSEWRHRWYLMMRGGGRSMGRETGGEPREEEDLDRNSVGGKGCTR